MNLDRGAQAESAHTGQLESGLAERRIPVLSGLRAVAVFLVVFFHSGVSWVPGGLGVLMFFVISGFLITWLLLEENARLGHVSLRSFYIRRALRIFPAFYFYFAISLSALLLLRKHVIWPQAIASLLYVTNYYQAILGDPGTFVSHTWSLSIEEQFYLCWPALFVAMRQRPRQLARMAAGLIAAVWIYRFILKLGFEVWQGYFYEAFDTRIDHLLIGCLLALLLFRSRNHRAWGAICQKPLVTAITVLLLILSTLAELHWRDRYRDTWGFLINPVLCALLIPQLISLRTAPLVRWLDNRAVRYLGDISYSLYLYQQVVLDPTRKLVRAMPDAVQIAVAVVVLIVVASGSYWFVERPFLRLKDRFFQPARFGKAGAAVPGAM